MRERESRGERLRSCVAIVAIFALLVAPFCAPLCAAKACAWSHARGASQTGECHHDAVGDSIDSHRTGVAAATATTCNRPELQAATLSTAKSWRALAEVSEAASHFLSSTPTQPLAFSSRANPAGWLESCTAIGKTDTPSVTTVLRI
jgi:hypothetical protein